MGVSPGSAPRAVAADRLWGGQPLTPGQLPPRCTTTEQGSPLAQLSPTAGLVPETQECTRGTLGLSQSQQGPCKPPEPA